MLEIPGYKIEKQIGKGGMAKVYLATHEGLRRKVALKVMALHLTEESGFSDRFMREARIVASLTHQNIVTVYDVNVYNGYHYIAMEYLPGGITLGQLIKSGITPQKSIETVKQIAAGLGFAHSKGVVHRDVKPENIMFREDGTAVLTDFGIARHTDSSTKMTSTGTVIGTPHYMSPEQAQGQETGPHSDIYSLGIVLYETLTGKVPYDADSTIAIIFKHISDPIPTLPAELEKYQPILNLMLAKKKEDRYRSCADIITDLNNLLYGGDTRAITIANDATLINHDLQNRLSKRITVTNNNTTLNTPNQQNNKWIIPSLITGIFALILVIVSILLFREDSKQALNDQHITDADTEQDTRTNPESTNQEGALSEQKKQQEELERKQQEELARISDLEKAQVKERREKQDKINSLLAKAEKNLLESNLESALENYKNILALDESNNNAIEGINRVAGKYFDLATQAASNNDFDKANQYISTAIAIDPTHNKLTETQSRVSELRNAFFSKKHAQTTRQEKTNRLNESTAGRNQNIPTSKPEIEQVGELITHYKSALESKDLTKLRKISHFMPGREQFLISIFQQYKSFSADISGFEFIGSEHRGKASVELTQMVDKNNQAVIPGNWSKFEITTKPGNDGKFYIYW